MKTDCTVTASHPVEVDCLIYGPGELVRGVDDRNPDNQALIESGQLTPKVSKKSAAKSAEAPNAGETGTEKEASR